MGCCGESNGIPVHNTPAPEIKSDCCGENKGTFTKYSLLQAGASVIRHFLDPTYDAFSPPEIKQTRLEACQKCEMLGEFFGKKQCSVCKCFVEPKSALIDQKCPHPQGSKW